MSNLSPKQLIKFGCRNIKYLGNTTLWLFRNLKVENFKNYIPRNNQSKNLLILANGPSLKSIIDNIIPIKDLYDVRVVNDFCRHPSFFTIKPSSYVFADPLFFNDTPRAQEVMSLLSKVDWNMNLYIPYSYRKNIINKISSPSITIIFYHSTPYNGWKSFRNYLFRKGLTMPRPQNVAIPSLFIAINEGYKTIELYGVDHSWTLEIRVNQNNQVCLTDSHFYDDARVALKPWNKTDGSPYQMHEALRDLAWMFDGYHILREYADTMGCRIINKTPDSFIDAFERLPN